VRPWVDQIIDLLFAFAMAAFATGFAAATIGILTRGQEVAK